MRTIAGEYTTQRAGGIAYTYEVSWEIGEGDWLVWSAEIRRDGALAGRPKGQVMRPSSLDLDATVRSLVCDAIERRVGIPGA